MKPLVRNVAPGFPGAVLLGVVAIAALVLAANAAVLVLAASATF